MDPLTHTFAGLTLARLPRFRVVPRSTLLGILAANIPDLDVLAYLWGEDNALASRRGWTHGPIGLVVLPWLLALAFTFQPKRADGSLQPLRVRLRSSLSLCYLAALSHPLLDFLNTYGIRWLQPVSDRWFYGDTLFIVDPWLWLGGFVLLGAFGPPQGRKLLWAWLALVASAGVVLRSMGLESPLLVFFLCLGAGPLLARLCGCCQSSTFLGERAAKVAGIGALLYVSTALAFTAWVRGEVAARLSTLRITPQTWVLSPKLGVWSRFDLALQLREGVWLGTVEPFPELQVHLPETREALLPDRLDLVARHPEIRGFLTWTRIPWERRIRDAEGREWRFVLDARYVRDFPPSRPFGWVVIPPDGPSLAAGAAWRQRESVPGLR